MNISMIAAFAYIAAFVYAGAIGTAVPR